MQQSHICDKIHNGEVTSNFKLWQGRQALERTYFLSYCSCLCYKAYSHNTIILWILSRLCGRYNSVAQWLHSQSKWDITAMDMGQKGPKMSKGKLVSLLNIRRAGTKIKSRGFCICILPCTLQMHFRYFCNSYIWPRWFDWRKGWNQGPLLLT